MFQTTNQVFYSSWMLMGFINLGAEMPHRVLALTLTPLSSSERCSLWLAVPALLADGAAMPFGMRTSSNLRRWTDQ